ncbi:Pentatricopeptide repeat [Dillenia turbinata]|uniref:Pentatricopeptide repeat n=1 Tax=Dillenia turbinata TaxID=194707 RepID=A0AAN8V0Y4_9MAGN
MLAVSRRFKVINGVNLKLGFLFYSCSGYWFGSRFEFWRNRMYVTKTVRSLHILCSVQRSGLHQCNKIFVPTPFPVLLIWPIFSILPESSGSRTFATHMPPDKEEVTDEVLNQILAAIEDDPVSSRDICSNHVDKLCRAGNLSSVARILQSFREKNIFLLPKAYNDLLWAAGEGNDIGLVCQIFKDLLVSSKSMSAMSYNIVAKAFTNTNDTALLLGFVREVTDLTFSKSITVVNRILYAFSECRQIEKALLIFSDIKSLKCKPDLVTYNIILHILGSTGRVDELLDKFASMKEANIVPDIISYNTVVNSLRKVGRLDLCLAFYREMGENGLEPDLRTCTALIESLGRSGKIEEALRLFEEMKLRGVRPSIYNYRSLINNMKKFGKLESAIALLKEMDSCPDLVGPKDFKPKRR